jgi:pimeloyl-ACP methyl ester carboxylesterase
VSFQLVSILSASLFLTAAAFASAAEPAKSAGQYATVNGLKMYYEVHGTGKPLVMLHGAFGWANVPPGLGKDRQVIAVELQGHGHTAMTDRLMTFENLADDVAALIKHLKLERADVFGYSMGGTVALGVAIRHPEVVRKVVVTGTHFGKVEDAFDAETFKQFKSLSPSFAPPPLTNHYNRVAPDPKQWPRLVTSVQKMSLGFAGFSREQMRSIKAPVLVTLGDHDGVRVEHAVEMFRLIPNAQLAIIPHANHFMIFQEPQRLIPLVVAFLDQPESNGR